MRGRSSPLVLISAALALVPASGIAQRPRLDIVLPAPARRAEEGPSVRSARLLGDSRMEDLLRNGFPARLHYKLERWKVGGWFDDLRQAVNWDVVVRYDPLSEEFRVIHVRAGGATMAGSYPSLAAADSAVGAARQVSIRAPRRGERSYYALRVDVEMLSVTDLDEVERWLRGELQPAVRGEQAAGTALERGARTLFVRLLGGQKRRYAARSETFRP